ncbi:MULTISPECIES: glutamyl-tRNA reductase [Clostridia]|jgi:glutamyl-tRNA reductase|uniref:Glutamyl-tRNA reductase n=2 Tax=Clostridia TaxID=186801 RepID=A0A8I0A7W5_9CLOT|nr:MULTISPECIES: glutamyl-tRNA reductase [Clostridia]MBC5639171.1 glutamyl-tRNA reductase [Clostridium lentum]MBC5653264.1 glutamyl-tRNA reductase [Blautia lenta]OKZ85651.1 MAG: glutamyl-tRNA reductase [Clostridium sp. 29_15]CDB76170.1 glutamyl-tRNA reductase [Clostridium sp. CAG:265]
MLGLIGIKKGVDVSIREKLVISPRTKDLISNSLRNITDEFVILSTCNRTEIYFKGQGIDKELIFEVLNWDKSLLEYVFYIDGESAVKHLFELACGFHSRILGEDQILGQIRDAYLEGVEKGYIFSELMRLFEEAISCGKRFRSDTKLYEIPVSSSSIAVNKVIESKAEKLMVMGYGTIGKLVIKYALGTELKEINIVVRDKSKVEKITDQRVNILTYNEARERLNEMDGLISCTAASHLVVEKYHINKEGKNILLIDLAMPRDIDPQLQNYERVQLLDIDKISKLDDENKHLRVERMQKNKYIIDKYIKEYMNWLNLRCVTNYIKEFKDSGDFIVSHRVKSFENKCKNKEDAKLAEILIKSTADYYINRAIKVLKNEKAKGREEQCLRILMEIFTKK